MIRNVNVYGNDDDEVEEVEIQISKKRKGTMDAFIAPIDVDFRPRAPNSNENKKALENIHGNIIDFFYENSISFNCARSDSYFKMMQTIFQYNDPSIPDDARDDIVLGMDMTYGMLEDAEDVFDDPPLTRTSRTNTASHCSQGGASSSQSTTRHLQDSSNDDDYDVDANYGMGDGDDDGIDSGSDEDIWFHYFS
ncbi:hypothetical protein GIB67_034007 [Kingdonia uniflora]|uniref:Uncharacterized protein n=1 Tax=Kingdonia uniflora TaxID=39325 RepID=A0A7J7M6B2_9MAGN|nr:hypothetical protein GIB67_034007 [Kingdonia uniflora]